ncbi:MAG: VirB8/TrbF family protein [Rickettsiales bacterium]
MNDANDHTPPPEEDHQQIADKVRTGEYFREAQGMYDLQAHDPMAERFLYVIITSLSVVILLIAFFAMRALYPLQTDIPFAVNSNDIVDELPRIKSLLEYKGEDSSKALLRFLVHNYTKAYEEYNINTFDRDIGTIKSQSSADVFKEYQSYINPRNPESPLALYQRHSKREINVLSSELFDGDEPSMEVIFEAVVTSKTDIKRTRWQANITFNYSGIELDEETEKVKPYDFVVTSYRSKRLQDVR